MPAPPFAALRVALIALGAAAVLAAGCADQAEGERCDLRNGDQDCAPGLACTSGANLVGLESVTGSALCCPIDTSPSVEACFPSTPMTFVADDAGAGDGGSAPAPAPGDAGVD